MYFGLENNRGCPLCVLFWLTLLGKSLQFPPGLPGKRFNIEAVPGKNGKIMLHLKSRYGSVGRDGPMGDRGPPGLPGSPGIMGEQGDAGFCPVEVCDAMHEARLLVSRVEALENIVKQRGLLSDIKATKPSESPPMALHIISDILLTKGNLSTGKEGLPDNIKVNIALKNAAPLTAQHGQKFLVNSTVQLMDSSKVNEVKNDLARSQVLDGVAATERQFQASRYSFQQEVPSIKKSRIPVLKNRKREPKNCWTTPRETTDN